MNTSTIGNYVEYRGLQFSSSAMVWSDQQNALRIDLCITEWGMPWSCCCQEMRPLFWALFGRAMVFDRG